MELFDKKFVHFMWNDELEGKEVFASNDIYSLMDSVNNGRETDGLVKKFGYSNCPFLTAKGNRLYQFVYYDPNYEVKRAFYKEGKAIQVAYKGANNWVDCDEPEWVDGCQFRVKPEEDKWIACLARYGDRFTLFCCDEGYWETAKKFDGAKTKLFVGSKDEAKEWCESRQKFAEVIKAWEDGKQIQIRINDGEWSDCVVAPEWCSDCEYRVKPKEKKYRPYESSAEMIADFIDRFKVNCPSYAEPLIWVRLKTHDCQFLITGIFSCSVKINDTLCILENLFNCYTYLDGSPCGMEVKE